MYKIKSDSIGSTYLIIALLTVFQPFSVLRHTQPGARQASWIYDMVVFQLIQQYQPVQLNVEKKMSSKSDSSIQWSMRDTTNFGLYLLSRYSSCQIVTVVRHSSDYVT